MSAADYQLKSSWLVETSAEHVLEMLLSIQDLPAWLPGVCRFVRPATDAGRFQVGLRGFLPHTVKLDVVWKVIHDCTPFIIEISATGDLQGVGTWRVCQEGQNTRVVLEQTLRAKNPLLVVMSYLARPICLANHNWIMRKVGEGLAAAGRIERLQKLPHPAKKAV